ncbi:MAG: DUF1674 domain-containing protein [Pseudomonadota bacterium]|nr:DUF1674 domain-containing protein [Pseudomonadota bacterium]
MMERRDPPPSDRGRKNPSGESKQRAAQKPKEIGGPQGLEPTRYSDWERKGRCIDF